MVNKKNVIIFLTLSVVGAMGTFFYSSDTASIAEISSQINIPLLLLCIIGVPVFDWLIAGLRMWIFAHVLNPDITLLACIRNCAIGSFMCAVTPSQTGGGIVQVWVLTQDGARTGQAITIMLMTFLGTLMFYFLGAVGLWVFADNITFPTSVNSTVFGSAVSMFGVVAAGIILALLFPRRVIHFSESMAKRLSRHPRIERYASRFVIWLKDSSQASQTILRQYKFRFGFSVILSILIFSNKFFAAYIAAQALGIEVSLVQVLIIQMFLNVLLYFLPTPGGAGGAEWGSAVLMSSLIPEALIAPHTIIWRSALAYMAVLVGGILFIGYLNRVRDQTVKPDPQVQQS